MSDENVIFATRVDAAGVPVAGSTKVRAVCGHDVWLAPSSRKMLASGEASVVYCIACGMAMIDEHPEAALAITDEQRSELRRELARRRRERW